jgi:hypothetical protein
MQVRAQDDMPVAGLPVAGLPACVAVFSTHDGQWEEVAQRYALVIWHNHPSLVARLFRLREKNPRFMACMYRELFCVQRDETPLGETVGGYEWMVREHPDWFQRDLEGRVVEVPDYPGRFMMDLGNVGWQEHWIQRTLDDVKRGGWDGVFVDDALTSVKMHGLPRLANYGDDAALQEVVYGFLKKAHEALQGEGKMLIANVSNSYDYPGLFEKWLGVTDGIMEEHFSGESWGWGPHVGREQFEAMQRAQEAGKRYVCVTYGAWEDARLAEMSLVAYMIGAGEGAFWVYRPYKDAGEKFPVIPAWASNIGEPLGGRKRMGDIYYREFSNGTLFIDPRTSWFLIKMNRGRSPRSHLSASQPIAAQ